MDVRPMTAADVPAVVALQAAYLEGSTITDLGPRFLTAFHGAALGHPATIAHVATLHDRLAGFVLASADVHQFNASVKPRILLPLVRALATPRRVGVLRDLVRGLRDHEPQPAVPAELLLLVVDVRQRRQGIGQCLLRALEGQFRHRRIEQYRVAVRSHLQVARAFYQSTGFEFEQELTVLGRPMTYLVKRIST
jgi:ribosomal protein S18 acetylase RimI-like enzyme